MIRSAAALILLLPLLLSFAWGPGTPWGSLPWGSDPWSSGDWGSYHVGPDLVTNGGFDTDTAWVKSAGATISGGKLNISTGINENTTQNIGATIGVMYEVRYEISNYTSGSCRIRVGFSDIGSSDVSENGNVVQMVICGGNGTLFISSPGGFVGSIDNVSVKQVFPD